MPKRRLPLLVDRTVADVQAARVKASADFEAKVRTANYEVGAGLTCRSGCANCCSHPVFISIAEGILLYRWLAERGMWTPLLKRDVREARDRTLGLPVAVWLLGNMPCPLLSSEKLCTAYEARPFACRATFSVAPGADCHPHSFGPLTRMVPRKDAVESFNKLESTYLKRHGLRTAMLMPLSEALLVGEAVVTGALMMEAVEVRYGEDFRELLHG